MSACGNLLSRTGTGNSSFVHFRCAQGKKFRSVTPNVPVHSMSPEEKFTHDDLAFLRHIIKQYITIDTESTVATLTPADVKTFYTAVREGRPLSYEAVETCQSIMTRSSSKVGPFDPST